MMNPFKDVVWAPGLEEKRKFAVSLMIGFPSLAIVFSLVKWMGSHPWNPFFLWMGLGGAALGGVLWLIPSIAKPLYLVWYFIACCIGFVVGNVLFCTFYFLVLSPVGLLKRFAGKPSFSKIFDKEAVTYWKDAEKVIDIKRYYRQF